MEEYLQATAVIDWQHPEIIDRARQIASNRETPQEIAQACFEWVRDEIHHSIDYRMNPVTCRASDVLQFKTGLCFAKSHLLAALLRANKIPAGFCYQRLIINEADRDSPYSLHGFNAIYLPEFGWYRVDARGNKLGVNAGFAPPQESLAYPIQFPAEADFSTIFTEPLPIVVRALQAYTTWEELFHNLPDVTQELAGNYGLV
jgi:transglutaminase-like putative cysteine protease